MQLAETAEGLSFQADTYSGALQATPLTGESAKHIRAHWLEAFSHLGCPQEIKTDNGPGYIAQATQAFLEKWGIQHKTGIPYCQDGRGRTKWQPNYNPEERADVQPGNHQSQIDTWFKETNP